MMKKLLFFTLNLLTVMSLGGQLSAGLIDPSKLCPGDPVINGHADAFHPVDCLRSYICYHYCAKAWKCHPGGPCENCVSPLPGC